MSCEKFDPKCRGCQPAIVDPRTMVPFPDEHVIADRVLAAWKDSSYEEQEAWWFVTVKNSRDPIHLARADAVNRRIKRRLGE